MDLESLSDIVKHSMRRRILLALYERKNLSYVDLMAIVEATNIGKFNYHLKILGDLIEKDPNGKYRLTEKGQTAAQLLQKFPEKKTQQLTLHAADATLIGFAGVVLTVVNPIFWGSLVVALLKLELTTPFLTILGFSGFAYALIVPGTTMWLFTVRRVHSHDMYDLLKPPFAAFVLLLVLLISMVVLKINVTTTITGPTTPDPISGGYYQSIMQTNLQLFLLVGLMFSFLGVLIAEFIDKTRRKLKA